MRLVLGAADQAVVSLFSLVSLVIAARILPPASLGAFAGAVVVYQVLIAVMRSLHGEPFVVLSGTTVDGDAAAMRKRLLVASVAVSVPFSLFGTVLVVASSSELVRAVGFTLVCAPAYVGYDAFRFILIATLNTRKLLAMDGGVVLLQISVLAAVLSGTRDAGIGLLAMNLVYLIPLSPAIFRERCNPIDSMKWYRVSRRFGLSFFYESIWGALLQWAIVFLIAYYAGLAEAAAFRSIVVIFGVTNVVTNYLRSIVLAHIVQRGTITFGSSLRDSALMSLMICSTIAFSAVVMLSISPSVGKALLGETWPLATPYIVVGALTRFSAAIEAVPGVLLRASQATWSVVAVRTVVGLVALVVCPIAVTHFGVTGAFYSMSSMSWVLTVSLFALLFARLRKGVLLT